MHTNDNDDKQIDWDKLLEVLDGNGSLETLNKEEREMLAATMDMQVRLHVDKFSEDILWNRFVAAKERSRIRRMVIIRRLIAAAVLVLTVGAGLWMLAPWRKHRPAELANALPSGNILLKRGGGVFTLGTGKQSIPQGAGAQIESDSTGITYAPKGNAPEVAPLLDTLVVPRGRQYGLELSDGTKVWLNAATTLVYAETFYGSTRDVYVTGEAYFEVAQNSHQPFIVHVDALSMKVLGTTFNVNTYETNVVTTLASGKLLVAVNDHQVTLQPGEQSVYNNGALSKHTVDASAFTAWKDGELFFDDAPMSDIAKVLSRNYEYNFVFDDPAAAKMQFTLGMHSPVYLQDVLIQINRSSNDIQFKVEDRTVHVTMKNNKP